MMKPIASQPNNLNQFVQPKPNIMAAQTMMPKIGTSGTSGVLNCLGRLGSVFLKMITAAHTSINANKVPILVISPTISPGINAANKPTSTRMIRFALYGVLYFGCTSLNTFGNKPSRLML